MPADEHQWRACRRFESCHRGVEPAKRETYPNGVRKADFYDPDGNELSFGGAPL